MAPSTVFLVDDNRTFLRTLTDYLQTAAQGEITVVGTVSDAREAIARATAAQPDVILLDLSMPEMSGEALLPQLRTQLPKTKIIVLTAMEHDIFRYAALATGAHGFVAKVNIDRDLLFTIRGLVAGKRGTP